MCMCVLDSITIYLLHNGMFSNFIRKFSYFNMSLHIGSPFAMNKSFLHLYFLLLYINNIILLIAFFGFIVRHLTANTS